MESEPVNHRLRLLVAGLAVLVVVAVVALVVIDPFSSSPAPVPVAGGSSSPAPQVTTTVNPAPAPAPPAQGAYFGAWVGPDVFTQANEIGAVDSLQQQIGHKLSIVHTYLKWQAAFPTASDMTFLSQGSMLLISWAGAPIQQINSGADDSWIRTRARQIKALGDRKSTRLNSSHLGISYAVFCLKKKNTRCAAGCRARSCRRRLIGGWLSGRD